MKGHWLKGEERVTVTLRDGTQAVEVELISISRPAHWKTKLTWNMIEKMQQDFFQRQLSHFQDVASATMIPIKQQNGPLIIMEDDTSPSWSLSSSSLSLSPSSRLLLETMTKSKNHNSNHSAARRPQPHWLGPGDVDVSLVVRKRRK